MGLLLDTCVFLWSAIEPTALSPKAARILRDTEEPVFISSISIWEVILKSQMGRYQLDGSASDLLTKGRTDLNFELLPFSEVAALHSERLPLLHKDPFDRMLVCQAMVGGHTIVTPDEAIKQYPVMTIW